MTERVLLPDLLDVPSPGERIVRGPHGHHLARVSRVRPGDQVVVFDGQGRECDGVVTAVQKDCVTLATGALRDGIRCDAANVTLLQGIPKGDRLETIVRQATELGVKAIWPVFTARCVPQPRGAHESERRTRLIRIAEEASRQCGRADIPAILGARPLEEAMADPGMEAPALRIVAWEMATIPLSQVAAAHRELESCAVLVGPEGGLDKSEVESAQGRGFLPVSLGPRILRTETVAPALLAALAVLRGDLALR